MNTRLRTLLVDDEPPARERLARMLSVHAGVEVIGEAGDVEAAADFCARHRPDLIFLDIQLPRASGFDLLPRLTGAPRIIFVTAFDRFAVRAFEVNAVDYLLKPVHPARLTVALQRVMGGGEALGGAGTLAGVPSLPFTEGDQIILTEDRGFRMVPVVSIVLIEAEGNFTRVHLQGGAPAFIRRTLGQWQRLLPPSVFVRLDRSVLIRPGAVRHLRSESRDRVLVEVEGVRPVLELRRRAALRLRQVMGLA